MSEKFLVTGLIIDNQKEQVGPVSFDLEMTGKALSADGSPLKISMLSKEIERAGKGMDIGETGPSAGFIIQSITRLTDDDKVIETTESQLMSLKDARDRTNDAYGGFANEIDACLSKLLKGIKSDEINREATINELQRLLTFTSDYVMEDLEDKELEA